MSSGWPSLRFWFSRSSTEVACFWGGSLARQTSADLKELHSTLSCHVGQRPPHRAPAEESLVERVLGKESGQRKSQPWFCQLWWANHTAWYLMLSASERKVLAWIQEFQLALSSRIFSHDGNCSQSVLFHMVAAGHMNLLSLWNMAQVAEELNFQILFKSSYMWLLASYRTAQF